jgi:hypothetical protein
LGGVKGGLPEYILQSCDNKRYEASRCCVSSGNPPPAIVSVPAIRLPLLCQYWLPPPAIVSVPASASRYCVSTGNPSPAIVSVPAIRLPLLCQYRQSASRYCVSTGNPPPAAKFVQQVTYNIGAIDIMTGSGGLKRASRYKLVVAKGICTKKSKFFLWVAAEHCFRTYVA